MIVVARPTRWGNPFTAADAGSRAASVVAFRGLLASPSRRGYPSDEEIRAHLAGHDLGLLVRAWVSPCHADVLLEIANEEQPADRGGINA